MGPQSEGAGGGSECGVSEDTEKAGCGRNSRHTAPAPAPRLRRHCRVRNSHFEAAFPFPSLFPPFNSFKLFSIK